jgi:hypothetical protein
MSASPEFDHEHLGRPSWVTGDIFVKTPRISLHAGEPWDFTCHILFEFQNSDIDHEHPEWMTNWFAGVSLLRTVGHVLRNVDRHRGPKFEKVINNFWTDIKEDRRTHWIFFDFIERERNNILKEFSFGARLPDDENDSRVLVYDSHDEWDGTELFREAVYWWRAQLEHLTAEII